jgi:hypothetical protein
MRKPSKNKTASSQLVIGQSMIIMEHRDGIKSKWLYNEGSNNGKNTHLVFKRIYQPSPETDPSVQFDKRNDFGISRTMFNKYIPCWTTFTVIY